MAWLALLLQLSPAEAKKAWRVPEGYEITLVAAEPETRDPVAIAFDARQRLWIAEMADYPLGPAGGRIRRLEDKDGDGYYESATLVASEIATPTGVLPFRDGVLVTAAPDLLYVRDGAKDVVFTGFSPGNQQHRVNSLAWTIDNWIQGSNGDSGGNVLLPDGRKVSISGRDFRFRPDFSGFEPAAGHAQFGNAYDDAGRRFICDNSNHLRHPVLPLGYLARHPALAIPGVEDSVSDHGGSCAIFPASPIAERPNDHFAAGRITSACGITIYRGDAMPELRGQSFVCEPVHNLVHRDRLEPRGASFVARRADEGREFLASTDPWCRPVNLANGPDGALYVVDMYRAVIEHPQWIPLEMQKRVDLRAGEDKGRIWRLAPAKRRPAAIRPTSPADLAHPNAWWRETAQRVILETRDLGAVDALRERLKSSDPLGRLHALWTLEGLGRLKAEDVRAALRDVDATIREHALRLAERHAPDAIAALAGDPAPRVRFQCALSVGGNVDALARILEKDVDDKWTRLAALSSAKGLGPALLARFPAAFFEKPGGVELVRQMAEAVGNGRDEAEIRAWIDVLTAERTPSRWRLAALAGLRRPGVNPELLRGAVDAWRGALEDVAFDPAKDVSDRVGAIGLLGRGTSKLDALLRPTEPAEVQAAAVRALGDAAALGLLDGWAGYTPPVRRELLAACLRRPEGAAAVLERLEKGVMRRVELDAAHRESLRKHPSPELRARAEAALKPKDAGEIEATIEALWAKIEKLAPDATRGEKVYRTSCATCHRLHGQGFDVGPNLGSVAGRDKKALLADLLDPNRAMAPQFQVYVIKTRAGELLTGVVAAETPAGITLKRANDERSSVARADIAEMKAWPASLMPEGLESSLSAQDFADLLDFLRRGQVK
jgi:putative membrane-bound dehydrogenase-like protein